MNSLSRILRVSRQLLWQLTQRGDSGSYPVDLSGRLTHPLQYESIIDDQALIQSLATNYLAIRPWETLDLACGIRPKNPFKADLVHGVDIRENQANGVTKADLFLGGIPFSDSSLDFVTAYDFIEHIPRVAITGRTRFPFVELMSDVHRVLKPDGLFLSRTPAFPFKEVFQDPTHVNVITEDTFPLYFCDHDREGWAEPWARMYGFVGSFQLVAQCWHHRALLTILRKSC